MFFQLILYNFFVSFLHSCQVGKCLLELVASMKNEDFGTFNAMFDVFDNMRDHSNLLIREVSFIDTFSTEESKGCFFKGMYLQPMIFTFLSILNLGYYLFIQLLYFLFFLIWAKLFLLEYSLAFLPMFLFFCWFKILELYYVRTFRKRTWVDFGGLLFVEQFILAWSSLS